MNNKKVAEGISSLDLLLITEPTQRFVLWVIANDSKAFSAHFIGDLLKNQNLLQPGEAPNLAKAMVIYHNLLRKEMIDIRDPFKTKIPWKGQFYRIYTHPFFIPFITIVGIIVTICGIILSNHSQLQPDTMMQEPLPKQELQDKYRTFVADSLKTALSIDTAALKHSSKK